MDIEKALNILSESHIIVERKKVSEMTPEEYEKDLAARRKRRELRKQRAANASPEADWKVVRDRKKISDS